MDTSIFDATLWSAISEPSRRMVIDTLLSKGESTASKLAEHLPISRQAISKHILVLQGAGLVTSKKQGKEMRFTIQPDNLRIASQELIQVARLWDRRLEKIKRIAESV